MYLFINTFDEFLPKKKKKSKKEKKNTVDASQGSKMSNGKSYNMVDGHDLL